MSDPNFIPPDIQRSAGPLLLGYVFNWGLYGALAVQVYMYYMSFPNDRNSIKALIFVLFVLETAQTILCTHDLFAAYAAGWGNLAQLGSAHLEWLATPIFSGIVSCTAQLFFAYRLSALSKSKVLGCVVAALALTQGASAITQGIQAAIINDIAKLQTEAKISCVVWLAGSALCDLLIAVSMSYYLSRKITGFRTTQVLINRLVRLTIETGSLTATVATVDVILFLAFPNNNYHTTPALTIAKLYTNSLVLTFNSRMRVIGGRDTTVNTDLVELKTTKHSTTINDNINGATNTFTSTPIRITTTAQKTDDMGNQVGDWGDKNFKSTLQV